MIKLLARLVAVWRGLFGDFNWSPPTWLLRAGSRASTSPLGIRLDRLNQRMRANPRLAMVWSFGALAVLTSGAYGTHRYLSWLESRPKPAYVNVTIVAPAPTDPEKKIVDKVVLNFSASAARMDDLNKDVTAGIRISPSVLGVWRWTSDRQLTFTPKGSDQGSKFDWPAGQAYSVDFDRKFFQDHLAFESRNFSFTTAPIQLEFIKSELYIDPNHPKIKQVVATVRSNYPLEPEDFKKRVGFTYQSADADVLKGRARNVSFGVTFNPFFTMAYLESEPFDLSKDDQVMTVAVAEGTRTTRGGAATEQLYSIKVSVPGLYSAFKIQPAKVVFARNEKFEPEQVLIVETGVEARSEDVLKAIEVLLLPADHKPEGSKKTVQGYTWTSVSELTDSVRKAALPVALKLIPTEAAFSTRHSFKIDVPVQRYLYLKVRKGIKGLGDYELGDDAEQVVSVPDFTPELMFMSQGSILSLAGDKKLPLLARNVASVTFEIGRVLPTQSNHLISRMLQSGSFSKPDFYSGIETFITEKFEVEQKLRFKSRAETIYFSLDLEPYVKDGRGFFYVKVHSKEPMGKNETAHRRYTEANDTRLILVTDLGMIAKKSSSGSTDVFVQDLRTGHSVGDAQVEVLGQNGIAALTMPTNAQGRAQFPDLKGYKNEKAPLAFVVKRGGDSSYLPYQLSERRLSLSRFDVGGIYESSESDRLNAMLFSDRGIYRPGDLVNLGLILRSKTGVAGLTDLPLAWSVLDPKGVVIKNEKFQARAFGLSDLSFTTQETSPTGNYEIRVSIVRKQNGQEYLDQLSTLTVVVEEFVPDQLKIQATLDPFRATGWIPSGMLKARVSLKNLFGSAAEGRRVHSQLSLVPAVPYVPGHKDYVFGNPNRKDARIVTENLEDKKTDVKGEVAYDIDLSKYEGYFQVRLETEGFQAEGGRSVNSNATVAICSLPYLVGYKADGDLHYINRGTARAVRWLAIDPTHKGATADGLKLALIERKYVSVLLRQDDGTYKYQSIRKDQELKEDPFSIAHDGTLLSLPTEKPGDFAFAVRDKEGRELNRVEFNVVGEANLARSLDRSSELQLVLNKSDYKPGEEIELQIKAPYSGAGLITIERDSVYAFKWIKASSASTVERIKIPEGLEGNAYVNVAFLRAVDSKEIFMSPLSYGVQPFSISLDQHRTKITLNAPEKVKPGQDLKIQYSSDRSTQLVLYGVDEGILQVAKYHLPDPIQYFFRKRALQVQTFQLLDLLLPEYSIIQALSASGGDQGIGALGANLNPFKRRDQPPVAFWSGVLRADAGKRIYTYHVPEYFNGNIKVMAVASSDKGLGSVEVGTLSRGDFVIQPTTPLFVAPGDEFVLGVNVSNQLEGADAPSKLTVSVETSAHLQNLGETSQLLEVAPGREKTLDFKMKALSKPGAGTFKFRVSAGNKVTKLTAGVSVRPAIPFINSVNLGLAESMPLVLPIDRKRIPEYRKTSLDVSPIPLALGKGLASYLADFPYGCTEQLISKAVPSLVIRTQPELAFAPGKAGEFHASTVGMLRTRQTADGGFGLYSGSEQSHPSASLYAIRYLTEAADRGMKVPEDVHDRMMHYLRSPHLRKVESLPGARLFAEALYLQARNSYVPSNDLGFLLEALEKNYKNQWEKDTTAIFVAGTYALLKQEEKGQALLGPLKLGEPTTQDYDHYQDGLSRDALLIQVVARHFPSRLKALVQGDALKALIAPLQRGQFNTFSSAQVLLALQGMLDASEKTGFPADLALQETVGGALRPLSFPKGLVAHALPAGDATSIRIDGPAKLPVFYALSQQGFDAELPKQEIKKGLEVSRAYLSKDSVPVTKVKLGDEVTVSLRTRAIGEQAFDHLVIVDLFPSGFELIAEPRTVAATETEKSDEGAVVPEGEGAAEVDGASGAEPVAAPEGEEGAFYLPDWIIPKAFADSTPDLSRLPTSFVDYREDRIVIYGEGTPGMSEFKYRLKAVNRGKFAVPPTFGESMYDRSIQYRGVAQSIQVE